MRILHTATRNVIHQHLLQVMGCSQSYSSSPRMYPGSASETISRFIVVFIQSTIRMKRWIGLEKALRLNRWTRRYRMVVPNAYAAPNKRTSTMYQEGPKLSRCPLRTEKN